MATSSDYLLSGLRSPDSPPIISDEEEEDLLTMFNQQQHAKLEKIPSSVITNPIPITAQNTYTPNGYIDSSLSSSSKQNFSSGSGGGFSPKIATPSLIIKKHDYDGVLSKWTNYIHGWQDRFIVLKDGILSYYKSKQDLGYGCRGSLCIHKATVQTHDLDDCRFDVSVNDNCVWYLRAKNSEEKLKWIEVLEHYNKPPVNLRRYDSSMSISSNTLSESSSESTREQSLHANLSELETYRDILFQQIDTLQKYFDVCSNNNISCDGTTTNDNDGEYFGSMNDLHMNMEPRNNFLEDDQPGLSNLNFFRGESITFKATTSRLLTVIAHCIEAMRKNEDFWKKRVEDEVEKRKKIEEYFKQKLRSDNLEVPNSSLKEDEFYDAIEEEEQQQQQVQASKPLPEQGQTAKQLPQQLPVVPLAPAVLLHPLWPEIERITLDQLHYARLGVGEGGWELFAEDGEMKMYKREEEVDGLVVDPLKAQHTVRGFTAREMCHYFFSPDVRMEWEMTLDEMTVLEEISEDTLVFLQIHKRVWPTTQRDAVFWSHIRQVPPDIAAGDPNENIWIVCNHSTDHESAPLDNNDGKYIRIFLTVSLVCQTVVEPTPGSNEITRDNLITHITYCSVVNPGGWAPSGVLRALYKREYPRFLKKFTQYVLDKCKNKPIVF